MKAHNPYPLLYEDKEFYLVSEPSNQLKKKISICVPSIDAKGTEDFVSENFSSPHSYLVSTFKCCKDPIVANKASIDFILNQIRSEESNLDLVLSARKEGKPSLSYDNIKTKYLPTFTPNATFHKRRSKLDVKEITGFPYLDVDGCKKANLHNPFIFASWISLSGNGRGFLVKVEGFNEENFPLVYKSIAKELRLDVDPSCKDFKRQVVMSYDPYIYINRNSKIYSYNRDTTEGSKEKVVYTPLTV